MPTAAGTGAIPSVTPAAAAAGQGAPLTREMAAKEIERASTIQAVAAVLQRVRPRSRPLHEALQAILDRGPDPGLPWTKGALISLLRNPTLRGGWRRTKRKRATRRRVSLART